MSNLHKLHAQCVLDNYQVSFHPDWARVFGCLGHPCGSHVGYNLSHSTSPPSVIASL